MVNIPVRFIDPYEAQEPAIRRVPDQPYNPSEIDNQIHIGADLTRLAYGKPRILRYPGHITLVAADDIQERAVAKGQNFTGNPIEPAGIMIVIDSRLSDFVEWRPCELERLRGPFGDARHVHRVLDNHKGLLASKELLIQHTN